MELITLKTFDNATEAHLLKSKLESEGIQTFLFDENMVTLNPLISPSLGGIKLKVAEGKLVEAEKILNGFNHDPIRNDKGEILCCPNCGSSHLQAETSYFRDGKGIMSMLLSFLLMVFPVYVKTVYRCQDCHHLIDK